MTLFVIDVGTDYGKYSIPILEKFCEANSIKLFVLKSNLKENIYNVHPSWLKLFCHNLVDDDFIVCWDLDLLPIKPFDLKKHFDLDKINMGCDWSLFDETTSTFSKSGYNFKFKFNCGLIGIPKSFSKFFEDIYNRAKNSYYPSYEQYHVNDKIYDDKVEVNIINPYINYFRNLSHPEPEALCVHYTWKIKDNNHRIELIKNHFEKNFENFN